MVIRRRLRKDDDLVLHPFSSFCPGDRFNGLLSILCGSLKREPVSFESVIESNDSEPSPIISASQGRGKRPLPTETIPSSQETNGCETAYSNPMMRFWRAVSTTSLVTTWSWLATRTCSTCF